ncbi:hypothetical protein AAHH80_39480, partial [Burkholderia pseudomallei]
MVIDIGIGLRVSVGGGRGGLGGIRHGEPVESWESSPRRERRRARRLCRRRDARSGVDAAAGRVLVARLERPR